MGAMISAWDRKVEVPKAILKKTRVMNPGATMAGKKGVKLQSMTPVLLVDAVEPGIAFWVDRFGFVVENQVPGPDGKLVFASVKSSGIELMYQTKASVIAED